MRLVTLLGTAVFSWPRDPTDSLLAGALSFGVDGKGSERSRRERFVSAWVVHCPFLLIFLLALSGQLLLSYPSRRAPQMGRRKDKLFLQPVPGLCGGLGWQRDANSFIFRSWRVFLKVTLHSQML